ncbi:MAG: hypothetical protein ACKOA8_09005 [Deltaproteobacteria bacterium]
MEEVIHYLEMKNKYYEKFFTISTKFLEETNSDQWDNLSFFIENRERLLNIIRSLDQKIARAFKDSSTTEEEMNSYRETLKKLFDRKKVLGDQIINIDLMLISKIDMMKTQTIKKLKTTLKTHHHIDSFERSSNNKRRRTKDA